MKIETATVHDARDIATLISSALDLSVDDEFAKWQAILQDGGESDEQLVIVARVDAAIVAFARTTLLPAGHADTVDGFPDSWCLTGVLVHPDHRRRGLAHELTTHRLLWLDARTDHVWFVTAKANHASIDLHTALGFVVEKTGVALSGRTENPHAVLLTRHTRPRRDLDGPR